MSVDLKLLLYHELHKISPLIVGNYHEHLKLSAISIHSHPVVSQDDNGICPDEEFVVDSMNMHAVRVDFVTLIQTGNRILVHVSSALGCMSSHCDFMNPRYANRKKFLLLFWFVYLGKGQ